MIRIIITSLLLMSFSFSIAQKSKGKLIGIVADSATGNFLPETTVSLLDSKDSALISFTISEANGAYEIANIATGTYQVIVSSAGYVPQKSTITISEKNLLINMGTVKLHRNYKGLEEVVIKDMTPIKLKGDTVSYNADAFKTLPNAVVEDLLKKLPGIAVDKDGTITTQGEQVRKVYVDGKEFFGNDPKLATKNLTADMVSEVEVYDDMSEQAKFNKIDDGSRSKAINLKLKKERKKGAFGQASAGYGTRQRYTDNFRANYFKGASFLSGFANTNNANSQNFSPTDLLGLGSSGSSTGGGTKVAAGPSISSSGGSAGNPTALGVSGFTDASSGGINYNDTWDRHLDFSGNYNINSTRITNQRNSFRQTFFSDSMINRNQDLTSINENHVNRASVKLTYTINENNSLILSSNITAQRNHLSRIDSALFLTEKTNQEYKLSDNKSQINNSGKALNLNNNLIWRKRFAKAGRTLSANLNLITSDNKYGGDNSSIKNDFNAAGLKVRETRFDQRSDRSTENNTYDLSLSYTEPLAINRLLELNYGYGHSDGNSVASVWDHNPLTTQYDVFNTALSNNFDNLNQYHRLGTNVRFVQFKSTFQAGFAVQQITLQSNDRTKAQLLQKTFNNFLANASYNYQFMRSKNLQFQYRGRSNQPNLYQLQPVRNISNPSAYYEGNPALGPEFMHTFSINYKSVDVLAFKNFSTLVNFYTTDNKIVNSAEQLGFGTQLTKPVNVDGCYGISAYVNYGIPIQHLKGGNIQTTSRFMYNHDISLINSDKNKTVNMMAGQTLRVNYNHGNKLDIGITARLDYSNVRYSVFSGQNNDYFTHNYSINGNFSLPMGMRFFTDVDYTAYSGRGAGFDRHITLWNAGISKQLFKNKKGEIKLSVFDILNENQSLIRNVSDNYVEDVQTAVLNRYGMLSFSLNFSRMGGRNKSMPAAK